MTVIPDKLIAKYFREMTDEEQPDTQQLPRGQADAVRSRNSCLTAIARVVQFVHQRNKAGPPSGSTTTTTTGESTMAPAATCPHNCQTQCNSRIYLQMHDPDDVRWGCSRCDCQYSEPAEGQLLSTGMKLNETNLRAEAREQVILAIENRMEDLDNNMGKLTNKDMANIDQARQAVTGYMQDWLTGIQAGFIQTVLERKNSDSREVKEGKEAGCGQKK